MPETTPVTEELDAKGITYKYFRHPGQIYSLEQAAKERGQRPEQIIRTIVFRLSASEFLMVLVAGPRQISWPKLREYVGQSRLTIASPEEVLRTTGYPTGAVSPFGLPKFMRTLLDDSVFQEAEVSIGSGVQNSTIIIQRDQLVRALGDVEIGKFVE
jgi:Cys-tRNA(Pro)/Cys-tRNA(Cys) deacylase